VRYIADSNTDEEDTISIDIHVAPYFWKSWWFILLAVIALGILFWQLYRLRLEAWRKQQAEKLLLPIKKVLEESDAPEHLQKRIQNILDNQERIQKSRHRSIETDKQQMQHIKGFMERATDILEHHYMDYQFDLTAFADAMGMSKSLLSKRIKQETGVGPNQFIRNYRLSIARDLILENYANRNITEIAYKVGFNDPKYFTRCFTHLYGTSPSTYK
jgi:AraC-like DNA-binding protein